MNFRMLDDLIRSGVKEIALDSDIILDRNHEDAEYPNGISVDVEDLVIDGQGHAIDARQRTRIFNITGSVVLKNLTLKNGSHIDGGAIWNEKSGRLEMDNCILCENKAKDDCGAIANFGKAELHNVEFTNNVAKEGSGGAIGNVQDGELIITDSRFSKNIAEKDGRSVYSLGRLRLTGCSFMDNNPRKGVKQVYCNEKGMIDNCTFNEDFRANYEYLDDLVQSGVKEIILDTDIVLDESEESKYHSGHSGIRIESDNLTIDGQGHSIDARHLTSIFSVDAENVKLKNIIFKNAFSTSGGAISNYKNLTIEGCCFEANATEGVERHSYESGNGGAIDNFYGDLTVRDCSFEANTSSDNGGAISNYEKSRLTVVGCSFKQNRCEKDGGAINNKGKLTVSDCSFEANMAKDNGGAIYSNNHMNLFGCTFTENKTENDWDSIFNLGWGIFKDVELKNPNERIHNKYLIHILGEDNGIVSQTNGKRTYVVRQLSEGERSFTHLYHMIQGRRGEIILENDILFDYYSDEHFINGKGIEINTDELTIDGQGHFIDAQHLGRILKINSGNVTLKNITFRHSLESAISNSAGLNVVDCSFEANTAINDPSAITNNGELNVEKSSFISNDNSAILSNRNSTFRKCIFKSNKGFPNNMGGAIDNWGMLTINDSLFETNTAHKGGAISNHGKVNIKRCSFKRNSSTSNKTYLNEGGGAIHNSGNMRVCDSSFEANTAGLTGGAIYTKNKSTIENCRFMENVTKRDGGGICNHESGDLNITDSIFKLNVAYNVGGAIYNDEKSKMNASDCTFEKNGSQSVGGAIYNGNFSKILDCTFQGNASEENIIHNRDQLQLYNSAFRQNMAGNIIFNDEESSMGISYGEFTNNTAIESVIFNNGTSCSLENIRFIRNVDPSLNSRNITNKTNITLINPKIEDECRSILNDGFIRIKKVFNDIECQIEGKGKVESYEDSQIADNGFGYLDEMIHQTDKKEIVLDRDITLDNREADFYEGGIELDIDGIVIDGDGKCIDGGDKSRIFTVTGKNITLKNITFKNGHSHKNYENLTNSNGGALRINHDCGLTIENCRFISNVSECRGGAIENKKSELSIVGCVFEGNSSNDDGGSLYNGEGSSLAVRNSRFASGKSKTSGGALFNGEENVVSIIETDFELNTADSKGGAIYIAEKSELNVCNSNFHSNSSDDGSAIYSRAQLTLTQSNFDENKSKSGGTIYNTEMLEIRKSCFKSNASKGKGGAICNYRSDETIISESTFKSNSGSIGGAIMCSGGTLTLSGNAFEENTGSENGGAVYCYNTKLYVKNTRFTSNCSQKGGAAYQHDGELNISDCHFTSNFSENGGAIFDEGCFVKIDGCTFKSNGSETKGGAIHHMGMLFNLNGSHFESNSSSSGGAIYNWGIHFIRICESSFKSNSATKGAAIFNGEGGEAEVKGCRFESNAAEEWGGAIFNECRPDFSGRFSGFDSEDKTQYNWIVELLRISGSDFISNSAKRGNAIYNDDGVGIYLHECSFDSNLQNDNIHSIYNNGWALLNSLSLDGTTIENDGLIKVNGRQNDIIGNIKNESGKVGIINEEYESAGSFTELKEVLQKSSGEIRLENDYCLDLDRDCEFILGTGIELNRSGLVIDGDGHVIDAMGLARIFDLENANVTFKNITFKNGFAKERGGAINTYHNGNLNIFGCRFVSNTAGRGPMFSTGGAIYCSHDTVLDIQDTHFESNVAMHSGAIDASRVGGITDESGNFLNKMKIINCTFKDNKPDDYSV